MVVDDSAAFRSAVHDLADSTDCLELVAEAESGEQALDRYDGVSPDVVLMDVRMPGVGGIEATRQLIARHPSSRVILVSTDAPGDLPRRAFECGAQAVIAKLDVATAGFVDLLRSVTRG